MTNKEKLIKTRNLVRYIIKEFGDDIDIKSRENHSFFFELIEKCAEVGIIKEDHGRYILTDEENL